MSLEDAIIYAGRIAEEQEENAREGRLQLADNVLECEKCAAEHRQLAEWLKDYKQLLEREFCEDAISRQAVIDTIFAECSGVKLDIDFAKVLLLQRAIKSLPPVTPLSQEKKTGHWITKSHGFPPEPTSVCSECGFDRDFFIYSMCSECVPDRDFFISFRGLNKIKYCPNCGAKMAESEGENDGN